jgi:DNA-binding transcriptional MocR family regulator
VERLALGRATDEKQMATANDIALDLASIIILGKPTPGQQLPHRKVLAQGYGASATTVGFALEKLIRCELLFQLEDEPGKLRIRNHLDEANEVVLLCRAADTCRAPEETPWATPTLRKLTRPVRTTLARTFSQGAVRLILTGESDREMIEAARSVLGIRPKRPPAAPDACFPFTNTLGDRLLDTNPEARGTGR